MHVEPASVHGCFRPLGSCWLLACCARCMRSSPPTGTVRHSAAAQRAQQQTAAELQETEGRSCLIVDELDERDAAWAEHLLQVGSR